MSNVQMIRHELVKVSKVGRNPHVIRCIVQCGTDTGRDVAVRVRGTAGWRNWLGKEIEVEVREPEPWMYMGKGPGGGRRAHRVWRTR